MLTNVKDQQIQQLYSEVGKLRNYFSSSIQRGGSGAACTKNIPHLHALGPQFCVHSRGNSACTKNTFFVHALARQFFMYEKHIWPTVRFRFRFLLYRLGVLGQQTKNIPHLHAQLPQFCMYEKHFFRTRTREAILHVRKTHLAYIQSQVYINYFCKRLFYIPLDTCAQVC